MGCSGKAMLGSSTQQFCWVLMLEKDHLLASAHGAAPAAWAHATCAWGARACAAEGRAEKITQIRRKSVISLPFPCHFHKKPNTDHPFFLAHQALFYACALLCTEFNQFYIVIPSEPDPISLVVSSL